MSCVSAQETAEVSSPCEIKQPRGAWSGVWCIRYAEVLLLQGTPAIGVICALRPWTIPSLPRLIVFGAASTALVAHIWSFNDWADFQNDQLSPAKAAVVASRRRVEPSAILKVSVALLLLSVGLFALLPATTLAFALAISCFGLLYSFPGVGCKGVPLLSSACHLAGGLLHFLLGYSLFASVDRRAILMAPFFALVFAAGHATQEVQDHDHDRKAGIRTNAACYGKTPVFLAGLAGFAVAYGYLAALAALGLVSRTLGLLVLSLFPLHLFWSVQALRQGLTRAGVHRLRQRYRFLIGLLGAAVVAGQLL